MIWLGATVGVPLAMLLACVLPGVRYRMTNWLALAAVPGLGAALFASGASLDLPPLLLRLRLSLDGPGALLLGAAALLWIAGGVYAAAWLRGDARRGRIAVWWLLTLAGSLGVFIAADLVSFYLLFSMVSLAAYGLVIEGATPDALRVGLIYVALAIFGEALLLMGFVMLAVSAPDGASLIRDVVAALPASPRSNAILTLIILGFGVKLGMVPFHVWMPITYRTAPVPAAAVLSGAAVKAGVIGLIRFLPSGVALPGWGQVLVVLGFSSAFYGVLAGVRQSDPRTVLAFSSVSPMGVVIAVFGMGLIAGDTGVALAAAFYGVHHTLVKGGLFLGVGLAPLAGAWRNRLVLVPAAIMALGMAGLPLTGGFLAKLAIKPVLGDGLAGLLGTVSSAATALLMTHFLFRVAALPKAAPAPPPGRDLRWPWLAVAVASVLVPWGLYPAVLGGSVTYALSASSLWRSLWPVLVGGGLGFAMQRWGGSVILVRDSNVIVPVSARVDRIMIGLGIAVERFDIVLREWPVAMLSLIAMAVALAVLMLAPI
jgi:formate hydrogenlyase subunit 3/multisubunit Na+/H+ antiporter MnhD subunit